MHMMQCLHNTQHNGIAGETHYNASNKVLRELVVEGMLQMVERFPPLLVPWSRDSTLCLVILKNIHKIQIVTLELKNCIKERWFKLNHWTHWNKFS